MVVSIPGQRSSLGSSAAAHHLVPLQAPAFVAVSLRCRVEAEDECPDFKDLEAEGVRLDVILT